MSSDARSGGWRRLNMLVLLCCIMLIACNRVAPERASNGVAALPWDSVLVQARGTTVVWRMWRGDPSINAFIDEWVAPRLMARYGITLEVVPGQGPGMVNLLVTEREAGARGSSDLLWINGATFASLRHESLLLGPWADRLPNAQYVDTASPIIARDFEQDPGGYESPWGQVEYALIYDSVRVPEPPRSVAELGAWIDAHPGRFTHDQSFSGMTFLKILMYALGGVERFQGRFDSVAYVAGRDSVMDWLARHRAGFWRRGATYPAGVAELHRLFANGEIDFSMSYNENEVITKVRQGILPVTARPLLLSEGMLANAHYLGIPMNARNPAGAMVVADFLLSPEAQLEKLRPEVWADGSVLDVSRLPEPWRDRFAAQARDPLALPPESLRLRARPEVDPEYHERLTDDWRRMIRANAPR